VIGLTAKAAMMETAKAAIIEAVCEALLPTQIRFENRVF
jgi:hypothetical protein